MANLQVTHSYTVSSNILALRIETGDITRGKQVAYKAQPGDKIFGKDYVRREGKDIGRLLEGGKKIRLFDEFSGAELDEQWATQAANYRVNGIQPKNVFIKSKPGNSARTGVWEFKFPMEHTVFLDMPEAMKAGQRYQLDFQGDELADLDFTFSPETVRSEAVHISHLGFHPNDPSKVAFLSTWMGTEGKGLAYQPGQKFWLLNDNGKKVFESEIELSKAQNQSEDFLNKNYNGTDVYVADFSDFEQAGNFRVAVEDVGTSFEFKIGENAWEDAFQTVMEGLYVHRSGLAKTSQFSDYTAPRSFHPDDGVKVYQSTAQFRYTSIGIGDQDTFKVLADGATDEVLDFAWGGWKDAGDWDRNSNHLSVARDLLELGEMFPDYFMAVDLTIPESRNNIADVIDEALYGVDFFQRMQRSDGGVRGGIESAKHPNAFEASWQESHKVMAYAPDAWTSYMFAGVAARAAHLLKDIDLGRAKGYLDSAEKAMNWAEKEQSVRPDNDWRVLSERNLAAAELYRATGTEQWHDLFLEDTAFKQTVKTGFRHKDYDHRDAAFVYAQTQRSGVNKAVQANAKAALLSDGDRQLAAINNAGFKWSKNPYAMLGWGANDGFADRVDVTRAHFISGDEKYLKGAVDAAQFQGGANPDNVSYTTGIGPRDPDNVLFEDGIATGIEPPKGIPIYGPVDLQKFDHWALDLFRGETSPQPEAWPTTEGFFDVARYVAGAEYTVTETIAPTAYAWGYLAANNAARSTSNPNPPVTPPTEPPVTPPTDGPDQPTPPLIRIEAESLTLQGYRRKGELQGIASGDKFVSLKGSDAAEGSAKGVFGGPSGRYRISVGHFDESDGQSTASLEIAGKKSTFRFDQDLAGTAESAANQTTKLTHNSVMLQSGDAFELISRRDGGEQGSVDYVEFEQVGAMPSPSPQGIENLLIDLTKIDLNNDGKVDSEVDVTFNSESQAKFDNTVGFYLVQDGSGAIEDPLTGETLLPGEAGYRQSAIANRLVDLDMTRDSGPFTTTLKTDQILAPFLVANDTPDSALGRTRRNMKSTYFAFEAANADGAEHIRSGGITDSKQVFSFEDRWNGGRKNTFNDVLVNTAFTAV